MATVYVKKSYDKNSDGKAENFEQAMKIFKRKVAEEGIMAELRRREYYMKPGIKRRRKQELAAIARNKKSK